VSEVSVDAARLPVAGIARVYDDDPVEVAGEPECGAQSGGPAADYDYVIILFSHAGRGCKFDSLHAG
jgi:hypothetical protein